MRRLNLLGNVTSTVGFPPKEGTWDFLKSIDVEMINCFASSLIGNSFNQLKEYCLQGIEITSVGGGFTTFSDGYIFSGTQNDIFQFLQPGSIADPTGGDVFIVKKIQTQYTTNADPVVFTDLSSKNVHDVIRMIIVAGTAGGGSDPDYICDLSDLIYIQPTVELRTSFNSDIISFERSRFISYTSAVTGTVTLDKTNASVGSEVVIYGVVTNTTTLGFSGADVFTIFNVGANVASSGRRMFRLKCVSVDSYNALGVGAGTVFITISDLNNA